MTTALGFALLLPIPGIAQTHHRLALQHKLSPCSVEGVIGEALCGHFSVLEDRGDPASRQLSLNIVVLPATTDSVAPDPLVFLAGGGVVPATRYAGFLTRAFRTLNRQRDILLIDQRGTWNSGALACDPSPQPASSNPDLGCLQALTGHANLAAYSTASAMDDLEAIRAWLGYPMINLYGVSYGTKAAQVFLKQYPTRVRAAVLYGVLPLGAPSQLDLAPFAQASLSRVFALCASDDICHAAFPHLQTEFDALVARLAGEPAQIPSASGQLDDRTFRNAVQEMLTSARGIERLPLLIHSGFTGHYESLSPPVGSGGPPPSPRGLFLSILCGESIPLVDTSVIAHVTLDTFFGDAPVRAQLAACEQWPRALLPADFWEPLHSDVPLLAISGDLDPITPPSYGLQVTATLPNARHLVLPNRSHGDVDPCITGLFERFLIAATFVGLDTSCVAVQMPLHFATERSIQ